MSVDGLSQEAVFGRLRLTFQRDSKRAQSVKLRKTGNSRGQLAAIFLDFQEQEDDSGDHCSYREKQQTVINAGAIRAAW